MEQSSTLRTLGTHEEILGGFLVLVGPITAYEDRGWNADEFRRAESLLRTVGYSTWSPLRTWDDGHVPGSQPHEWYLRRSMNRITMASGLAVLSDPETALSYGCVAEIQLARWLKMPVKSVQQWLMDSSRAPS